MAYSDQLPNPSSQLAAGWSWLQGRLERTELLVATHELDEWLDDQLHELEAAFQPLVTVESNKVAASGLIVSTRRQSK